MDVLVLLRSGKKILKGVNTETKCGADTEGKAIHRLPHLGIHPHTDTKPRHYYSCQKVLSDMSLI